MNLSGSRPFDVSHDHPNLLIECGVNYQMHMLRHYHIGQQLELVALSCSLYGADDRLSESIVRQNRQTIMDAESYESDPSVVIEVFQFQLWSKCVNEDSLSITNVPYYALFESPSCRRRHKMSTTLAGAPLCVISAIQCLVAIETAGAQGSCPVYYNGIFPCFFGGLLSRLVASMFSARMIRGRVWAGSMMSSI